jgi:ribonuclease BN (tRNA processing enzyme)
MRIVFLGTNGWYDTQTGNTLSALIETNEAYIVLDAGNGIFKLDKYALHQKPVYLFLSHFHLDHVSGLHILGKFDFGQGLKILGEAGTRRILNTLVNDPFTIPLGQLNYKTEIYELPEEQSALPFKVLALPLIHSSHCLGFRLEVEGRIVSYCTDTGYCENAIVLARDADLLIAECSLKSGQADEAWPHLNPETAALMARESGVKRLVLTHFDASVYTTLEDRREAEREARKTFANTYAAFDDIAMEI